MFFFPFAPNNNLSKGDQLEKIIQLTKLKPFSSIIIKLKMEKEKEKIEQLQKGIDELQKELDSTKRAERIECE